VKVLPDNQSKYGLSADGDNVSEKLLFEKMEFMFNGVNGYMTIRPMTRMET